ncbi:hypothetical protein FB45DRAFT_927764, partial [Roridomyces roridus]
MLAPGWWLVAQLVLAIFTAVWGGFRVAPWLVASSPGCFDQFWCCTVWGGFCPCCWAAHSQLAFAILPQLWAHLWASSYCWAS